MSRDLTPSELWRLREVVARNARPEAHDMMVTLPTPPLTLRELLNPARDFAPVPTLRFRREEWACKGKIHGDLRYGEHGETIRFEFWRADGEEPGKPRPYCPRCWVEKVVPWFARTRAMWSLIMLSYAKPFRDAACARAKWACLMAPSRARELVAKRRFSGNAKDRRRARRALLTSETIRLFTEAEQRAYQVLARWDAAYAEAS